MIRVCSRLVPGHYITINELLELLFVYLPPFFVVLYFWSIVFVVVVVYKNTCQEEKGKTEDSPNGYLLCSFSQAEEGQYGNCFQLQSLQIFPDNISASLTLPERVCMGPRPFSKHQSVDAKQSNYNSCPNCRTHCLRKPRLQWVRLRITRLLCTCGALICRSRGAKDRDKELQSYRDGKQDRSNDTQTSNPYTNHTN